MPRGLDDLPGRGAVDALAAEQLLGRIEELFARWADFSVVEPVEWTRSNRHTGIRHLMVEAHQV